MGFGDFFSNAITSAIPGVGAFRAEKGLKSGLTGSNNKMNNQVKASLQARQNEQMAANSAMGKAIIGSSTSRYSVCPYCGRSG